MTANSSVTREAIMNRSFSDRHRIPLHKQVREGVKTAMLALTIVSAITFFILTSPGGMI